MDFPDEISGKQFKALVALEGQRNLGKLAEEVKRRRNAILSPASLFSVPSLSRDSGSRASSVSGGPETPRQLPEVSGAEVAFPTLDLDDLREEDEDDWLAKGKP